VEIMQRRLHKLGVEGKVRREGANVIVVAVPGSVHLSAETPRLLAKSGLLEFYDFETHLTGPSVTRGLVPGPVAKPSLGALLGKRRSMPRHTVVVRCKVHTANCLSVRPLTSNTAFYLFKEGPEMTARDLDLTETRADIDPNTNAPVVVMQFSERGQRIFHEITRREAERGALACAGHRNPDAVIRCAQHFAIVLDREIVAVPYIDFVRNPDGISGDNGAQIDLGAGGSLREAKRVAIALQTGALPVQFVRLP
jgi:preprotein translocase subunit SecD